MESVKLLQRVLPKYKVSDLSLSTPKGKLNLRYMDEKYLYSDGDIEQDMLYHILNQDTVPLHTLAANAEWPIFAHFSDMRKNILKWYEFEENSDVLEIGSGMGAITELLCEKACNVTAVELSLRRGLSTLYRCEDFENLEVLVGNINDINFEKKYDYITLIGVLEYQGKYTKEENPYVAFLKKIKSLLKDDGKLIIAIENKYGIKYWCGIKEDHTGMQYDGLNDYNLSKGDVRTFSKKEIYDILQEAGFENNYFYYPYPDYKTPQDIFSEKKRPKHVSDIRVLSNIAGSEHHMLIDDRKVMEDIIENDLDDFFSNSFLIECGLTASSKKEQPLYVSFSNERIPEIRLETICKSREIYIKRAYQKEAISHLNSLYKNLHDLKARGVNTINVERIGDELVFPNMNAPKVSEVLADAIVKRDAKRIIEILELINQDIKKASQVVSVTQEGTLLKEGYLDMIPQNAFWIDGKITWFDQEWKAENVIAEYILYRGLELLFEKNSWLSKYMRIDEILNILDIDDNVIEYKEYEYNYMENKTSFDINFRTSNGIDILKNMEKAPKADNIMDKFISLYSNKKKIFLYGAGRNGQKLAEALCKSNFKFEGFIISDNQVKREVGFPIWYLSECLEENSTKDIALIITIENRIIKEEIEKLIKEKGIIHYMMYK